MARYIFADDLSGACDAGLAFAKRGARTIAWLDARRPPASGPEGAGASVLAIDLDSRELRSESARAATTALLERLRPAAPTEIVKKIDSTLRGNIASETQALLDYFPGAVAIVAPSYPAQGRSIRDGRLVVRAPTSGDIRLADRFARARTRAIGLGALRAGGSELASALATVRSNDVRIALVDAETDADLRALVAATRRRDDIVWVGSAGLMEALADSHAGATATVGAFERRDEPATAPRVLFAIGSRAERTREQIAEFAGGVASEIVDANAILARGREFDAALTRAFRALDENGVALVAIGGDDARDVVALRTAFVASIAARACERPDLTLVLSGGAIARAFCEAAGIVGLAIRAELAPGIPLSHAIGAPWRIVTKAGGFGTPQSYPEVLRALRERLPS